jgi:hypothetical protein
MKNTILFLILVCLCFNSYSQSENYLLGKVYTKSTGKGSSSDLSFNNRTTGVMEGVSDINGREYIVSTGFSYTINGNIPKRIRY